MNFDLQPKQRITLPETNSSPLKTDGWKMILSFWGPAYFQGRLLLNFGGVLSQEAAGCLSTVKSLFCQLNNATSMRGGEIWGDRNSFFSSHLSPLSQSHFSEFRLEILILGFFAPKKWDP